MMKNTAMRRLWVGLAATLAAASTLLGGVAAHAEEDPNLAQSVAENETVDTGTVVINHGHVDIGPRIVDGEWVVMARDDSVAPPVWHPLNEVVIRVVDGAQLSIPEGQGYDFLSASPSWYVIPQTEMPGVVWLGWNTQDPQVTQRVQRGVTMTLGPVEGPGEAFLFLQDGTFGEPRILMDGTDGKSHDVWVDVNTHVHANWAFSAPGVYTTPLTFTAETSDGATLTHTSTLRFAVGTATSADEAFKAQVPAAAPAGEGSAQAQSGGPADGDTQSEAAAEGEEGGNSTAIFIAIFIGVMIPLLLLFVTKSRQAKAEAAQAMEEARLNREAKNHPQGDAQ